MVITIMENANPLMRKLPGIKSTIEPTIVLEIANIVLNELLYGLAILFTLDSTESLRSISND